MPSEAASFDIVCHKIASGLEICIHDKGLPWDPTLDEDYHPDANLKEQTGRGLGEYLIKHLVDGYTYLNLGHDGKQVRLVKYLGTRRVGDGNRDGEADRAMAKPAKPPWPRAEPLEFDIRPMRRNEAIDVSRTIYDSYGYSYASDFVYYPDRIAAMNERGEMLSAIAVARNSGEIVGHNALLFSDKLPAEVAIAATKQQFRGHGIAQKLAKFLEDRASAMGLKGLYMKEVTVHPYTQKFAQKLGFQDCGVLLAHSPKTLSFKGIADEAMQRNSDVLGFKQIGTIEPRELYIPDRHDQILASIYSNLGIPLRSRSSTAIPSVDGNTVIKSILNPSRSLCEIHVSHYGGDFPGMLKQELRRIRQHEIQLVEMYLNLADDCTPWAVSEAETIGFFFTGILPETAEGDSIILQYFNGIQVEYDELVIDRPGTVKLLEYVKALDPTMV